MYDIIEKTIDWSQIIEKTEDPKPRTIAEIYQEVGEFPFTIRAIVHRNEAYALPIGAEVTIVSYNGRILIGGGGALSEWDMDIKNHFIVGNKICVGIADSRRWMLLGHK